MDLLNKIGRLICALLLVTQVNANIQIPALDSAPGTYVWIGNHRLHIHCIGQGSPTVVFDSGLGGTALVWARVQAPVAEFTRACVYDRAGYGWSDPRPGARTSLVIVSELDKLLGYGGVSPPYILVGHSFGGLNVRLFANKHPHRISGMVLVDSAHEEQFIRFRNAGLRTPVPTSRMFVLKNRQEIPTGLPESLQPLAKTFAANPDFSVSLYSELRYFRASAAQVRAAKRLPDIPLVVITHNVTHEDHGSTRGRMAELWMEMQEDLAERTGQGALVMAQTDEHHIQLHEPAVVVDAIRSVVAVSRESESVDHYPKFSR